MNEIELLVVSDTHGNAQALAKVLKWADARGIRAMAFLGDGASDPERAIALSGVHITVSQVRGNNDWDGAIPWLRVFEFAGRRFVLTHGHQQGAHHRVDALRATAMNSDADALLFGHTHKPLLETHNGVLLLNPGSLSQPRGGSVPSFATISCPPEGSVRGKIWNLSLC